LLPQLTVVIGTLSFLHRTVVASAAGFVVQHPRTTKTRAATTAFASSSLTRRNKWRCIDVVPRLSRCDNNGDCQPPQQQQSRRSNRITAASGGLFLCMTFWTSSPPPFLPFFPSHDNYVARATVTTTTETTTPDAKALSPRVFEREYSDPFHPECRRKIRVSGDGTRFHFEGTSLKNPPQDGILRGCSSDEIRRYGIRRGSFDGDVITDANRMPKLDAHDGIHDGVWEPAGSVVDESIKYADVDGIRWKDGNKWIVKQEPVLTKVGEFVFLAYIGVSTFAGIKWLFEKVQVAKE